MKPIMTTELVLDALIMAVWRRSPTNKVLVHSDQGSQYTSYEWQEVLKQYGLESSMSRRGNCHDNAVAESCNGQEKSDTSIGNFFVFCSN